MEFKTNKIDGANAEITATLAQSDINANIDRIAKQIAKDAKVDGFRKGKVPVAVIKKQYGEKLVQDAEAEELRKVLDNGLKDLGVANDALIGEPQVTKFEKADDKVEVAVTIALRPQINIDGYTDEVPETKKPEISDEAVLDRIQELAAAQAPLVKVTEDRAAENGDVAVIDFEGSVDGELFEGGSAEKFELTLGSNQFIPGFEDQVVGMEKGEEKVIKVTFPESYGSEALAGKDSEFKVKLHELKVKESINVDDELAKKMLPGDEEANVEKLKEQVKAQMEKEEISKIFQEELKPKLLETLVNKYEFDLPNFVVEQEMDMALNKKAQTMSEEEIKELRENQDKAKELREEFREDAVRSVKATFIIDALAKAEDVKVEETEIMQTIYMEALRTGQDPVAVYDNYKNSGYLPAVQMAMVEDKVLSKLMEAKLVD